MAETANIARMAEKISDEIFSVFLWDKKGPLNTNWKCMKDDTHKKDTHPSDVVFFYDEPYRPVRTYIQTDLKSYSADSISPSKIEGALRSLGQQISCADISSEYQALYTHSHVTKFEIIGLLFIFNHDGEYDKSFENLMRRVKISDIEIPVNRKLVVLGPRDIYWINNVSHDIQWLRGRSGPNKLISEEYCSYFYPQDVKGIRLRGEMRCAAVLEMLTGPWIILKYHNAQNAMSGFVIYYRSSKASVDEFLYFLDFMRRHGILGENHKIRIRYIEDGGANATNFQTAQQQYADQVGRSLDAPGTLAAAVRDVTIEAMNNVITKFSASEIGLEYDR